MLADLVRGCGCVVAEVHERDAMVAGALKRSAGVRVPWLRRGPRRIVRGLWRVNVGQPLETQNAMFVDGPASHGHQVDQEVRGQVQRDHLRDRSWSSGCGGPPWSHQMPGCPGCPGCPTSVFEYTYADGSSNGVMLSAGDPSMNETTY